MRGRSGVRSGSGVRGREWSDGGGDCASVEWGCGSGVKGREWSEEME